ncbi:hypothetical protein MSG28_011377 [Choristoneura fumiferana]|uniref:Uncharacterized protein n=1 Tax=Choristoneura fumiferana TaxID=7141 RepID=A0ACC0JN91_CHOFU|nr:hypothetical protein MSG28_011377 [Choristoneura fumiferana]
MEKRVIDGQQTSFKEENTIAVSSRPPAQQGRGCCDGVVAPFSGFIRRPQIWPGRWGVWPYGLTDGVSSGGAPSRESSSAGWPLCAYRSANRLRMIETGSHSVDSRHLPTRVIKTKV